MYFQVSPVHRAKPTKKVLPEPEEIPVLSLAPFTAIPKICFDNVLINTNQTKTLIIHNPTPNNIKLYITRAPPDERRFTLSWVECTIRSQEKVALELYWEAVLEGGWKDTLTFEDGRRIKKDVSVIFKAVKPKKAKPKPKKTVKCVSTKVKSPKKWFSPKQKSPKPTAMRSALPDITNIPRILVESPRKNTICNENTYVKNKENLELSGIEFIANISSRNVFCDIGGDNSKGSDEHFDDSLEMQKEGRTDFDHSHRTVLSIEDKLNALIFEPTQFGPSFTLPGEKTLFFKKEDTSNMNISSTVTYDVLKCSPQSNLSSGTYIRSTDLDLGNTSSGTYNIEERLSNISTGTFVKANVSSSTYTKEAIGADLNFSDRSLSPIRFENENNDVSEGNRPKKMLEQILEESTVMSDVSQLNRTDFRKRRSENCLNVVSPKRRSPNLNDEQRNFRTGAVKRSYRAGKALNLRELVMKTKQANETLETVEEITVESTTTKVTRQFEHDTPIFTTHNPFILTAIDSIDPFMSGTLYYDSKWVDEQESGFKKWLNALLTPPAELNSNTEAAQLDIVKVWQDCKKREVSKAPTRETVSSKYHTKTRLDSLRRSASVFFRSKQIGEVHSKVCMMIENRRLVIRDDRDVHLDLGLQAEVLRLFLSYNPLWLRIGLETVYNSTISLNSNSDVVGLVMFLSEHFFKDQYLMRKFKTVHSKKYALEIKKLVLKKFLTLIFFLDKAKETKLIPHDPCLFCKNAPYKESRDIILKFSCELLSSIGDITKVLKPANYILNHKQTYIHEFDYAVNNLGADLRDGVRLTRVMEIILTVEGLTDRLRVPAISRLQKIHNVKIVFEALNKSGHTIMHEIEPKDIVDGHKEKTLSFLWQIIYKFQSPRITKAIVTIQKFWRSLHVTMKRRILLRERLRRESAAIKLQRCYRRRRLRHRLEQIIPIVAEILHRRKLEKAATLIQSVFKMVVHRKRYLTLRTRIIKIQSYSRRFLISRYVKSKIRAVILIQSHLRMYIRRKQFLSLKASVRYVEEIYAGKRLMQTQFEEYRRLKSATLFVQAKFRAKLAMRKHLEAYTQLKSTAMFIQHKFRANKLMQKQRNDYLALKTSTIFLQQIFRANKFMLTQRTRYENLRNATITIQRIYRAKLSGSVVRKRYLELKSCVRIVEEHFLAMRLMKRQRHTYLQMRKSVRVIEERYSAKILANKQQKSFVELKRAAVTIQRRFRAQKQMKLDEFRYERLRKATIVIQTKFRASQLMLIQRKRFLTLKRATIFIQRRFRLVKLAKEEEIKRLKLKKAVWIVENRFEAILLARKQLKAYKSLRESTVLIQRKFRAHTSMLTKRKRFLELRRAAVIIQKRFRANKLMLTQRTRHQNLRDATITIQRLYRAKLSGRIVRKRYLELKSSVGIIEDHFLATKLMKRQRQTYLQMKKSVGVIEERYTAKVVALKQRENFLELRRVTVMIQRRFRAHTSMLIQRKRFLELKRGAVIVQRRFRANDLMRTHRTRYEKLRDATVTIQRLYRAKLSGRIVRKRYLELKSSVRTIEEHLLAMKLMKQQRETYLQLRNSVRIIEERYKAKILAVKQQKTFLELKKATVLIQRRFIAQKQKKNDEDRYKQLRKATVSIQMKFRANKLMLIQRKEFLTLKTATIFIQRRFRLLKLAKEAKIKRLELKKAVSIVESRFEAILLARKQLKAYKSLRESTVLIQRKFRAHTSMLTQRQRFLEVRRATTIIQKRYRANKLMLTQRTRYQNLRDATITIQRHYRAKLSGRIVRKRYLELKSSVRTIEDHFSAIKLMKQQRQTYLQMRKSVRVIEERYSAKILANKQQKSFLELKRAVVTIQRRFRAQKQMKLDEFRYKQLRKATIAIQTKFRANQLMLIQRKRFLTLKRATIFIQRRFRLVKLAKEEEIKRLQLKRAVRIVENRFEARLLARKQLKVYKSLRESTVLIQRRFRAHTSMVAQRERFLELRRAAIIIQRRFRANKLMRIPRREYLELRERTIIVQNRFRANILMRSERLRFRAIVEANLCLQRRFRATLLMRVHRIEYLRLRNAAVVVQKRYRELKAKKRDRDRYLALKMAVVTIEERYLANKFMLKRRGEFLELKRTTLFIQKRFREILVTNRIRREYLILRKSADVVQRRFRANKLGQIQRQRYQTLVKSVVLIQRLWRARRIVRKTRANIVIIQAFVRGFLARKTFERHYLPILIEKRERRALEGKAATKIQASWRGYKSRSVEKPELKTIREKVKVAKEKVVPQNTLAYKKEKALDIMVSEDSTLDQIITALQDLDYETRLFKQSCTDLSRCLPEELYRMITTSSRSVPEMQSCTAATSILINFCKHSTTINNCWHPEYMDDIFTVMIHWCDKDYPLFAYLCTLIWHLAQHPPRNRYIKALPKLPQKLNRIKQLCERKYKMAGKIQHKSTTPDMFGNYKNLPAPSIGPDWGLEYKKKPRTFKNAVHALHSLLNLLKLDC